MPPSVKYRKGILMREHILQVALSFVAEHGYNQATVRDLAEAVGISKTGLMHHFDSKEELFAEILRRRDELDEAEQSASTAQSLAEGLPESFSHMTEVPGIVQLFARFSAEATDPSHSSHTYFAERYARWRDSLAASVRREQETGGIRPDVDPDLVSTALLAAMDGLQIQWLFEPDVDMVSALSALLHAMTPIAAASR